jgi:hypothetical protein
LKYSITLHARRAAGKMRKWLMAADLTSLLRETINRELPHLLALTDEAASQNDGRPGSWTRKQELGHLIDSAAHNHMRFVLASIDGEFRGMGYAQDKWVAAHGYGDLEWRFLVDLWYRFNTLLVHLVKRIPENEIGNRCVIGWGVVTLGYVIEDYILHMRHHLDHVLGRETAGRYPTPQKRVGTG